MGVHQSTFNLETIMIHEGAIAEQFIAQHLTSFQGTTSKPELFYWLREGKTSNAEVDFLVQRGRYIIPIEVKARKAGAMKSLLHVMTLRGWPLAVKFSLEYPSIQTVSHQVATLGEKQRAAFDLLTLPLYFVEYLPMILDQWIYAANKKSTL